MFPHGVCQTEWQQAHFWMNETQILSPPEFQERTSQYLLNMGVGLNQIIVGIVGNQCKWVAKILELSSKYGQPVWVQKYYWWIAKWFIDFVY